MNVLQGDGATFQPIQPAGFRILAALDDATTVLGVDLAITCGSEGHPRDDPHTTGEAYDVRVKDLPKAALLGLVRYLRQRLVPDYFTVLLETPVPFTDPDLAAIQYVNRAASGPHLHIQRRKGTVYPPAPTG